MIINIPGREPIEIKHIVFDYNGTIAIDGKIKESVKEKIYTLSDSFSLYVLTADTYGSAKKECENLPINLKCFPNDNASVNKLEILTKIGASECICFGNGYNDIKMFEKAALSVAVLESEGCCSKLLNHADILVRSIDEGLDLILNPNRIIADLRL
ncbi:MAG: HAD family hydrolase [Lachnospirales bacterium]